MCGGTFLGFVAFLPISVLNMTDKEKEQYEARLSASKSFFANVAHLCTHLDKYLQGDEKERPIVEAIFKDIYIYVKKVQLAVWRNGEKVTTEFYFQERVRLNQKEFENLKRLNELYLILKE